MPRILQQTLQESVLVLEALDAARQIVHLGLEQLNLLGELRQGRGSLLGTFQASS